MKIQFEIKNKQVFVAVLLISFITLLTLAIAYNSANPNPAVFGHSMDEISGRRFAIYTSNGTFTVPSGVTKVLVEMVGGGGGGCALNGNAGGGGGGAYLKTEFAVTPGQAISIVVGSGGRECPTAKAGGNSSFGAVSVDGGNGGSYGVGGIGGVLPSYIGVRSAGQSGEARTDYNLAKGGDSVMGFAEDGTIKGGTGTGGFGYRDSESPGNNGIGIVYW